MKTNLIGGFFLRGLLNVMPGWVTWTFLGLLLVLAAGTLWRNRRREGSPDNSAE